MGFGGTCLCDLPAWRRQLRFPRLQVVEDVAGFVNFVAIKLDLLAPKICLTVAVSGFPRILILGDSLGSFFVDRITGIYLD